MIVAAPLLLTLAQQHKRKWLALRSLGDVSANDMIVATPVPDQIENGFWNLPCFLFRWSVGDPFFTTDSY